LNNGAAPGTLLLALSKNYNWLSISPDHDFGILRNATFSVEINPLVEGSGRDEDHWAGLMIGADPCVAPTQRPGVALLLHNRQPQGGCEVIMDGVSRAKLTELPARQGAYRVSIELSNGNHYRFLVNDKLMYEAERTSNSTVNYIGLLGRGNGSAMQFHSFDNLRVTVPVTAPTPEMPELWIAPSPWPNNGRGLRQLIKRDGEWAKTREKITGLFYWPLMLDAHFSDAELKETFAKLNAWHKHFGLEVPVLKQYLPTAADSFALLQKQMSRFVPLGIKVRQFSMDEPFYATRAVLKKSDTFAVEQTADYIVKIRKAYPEARIGSIEPFPALSRVDLEKWITSLDAALAARSSKPVDFFRVDVDWANMNSKGPGNWAEVKKLEDFCRARHTRFSLIYWDAQNEPLETKGYVDNVECMSWYCGVMTQGGAYAYAGGRPDEYVIESWVPHAPQQAVPETDKTTFTASVLDFYKKFIQPLY
jgi:hypothetical protein